MTATGITVAFGDGIGPEIMEATLYVLREAGADIRVETIELGQRIYNMNGLYGILPGAWQVLKRNPVLLKAPTAAPPDETRTDVSTSLLASVEPDVAHTRSFYAYLKTGMAPEVVLSETEMADEAYHLVAAAQSHISEQFALFEPIAADEDELAGKDKANPCGMLLAAIKMLEHIGLTDTAQMIDKAWRHALEEGMYTHSLKRMVKHGEKLGTAEFAEAVASRLHRKPKALSLDSKILIGEADS